MLRARIPLAVAALTAGVVLIPASTASAATNPLDGTPLGTVLTQVQNGLSNGGGGGSAPDVQGALTTFTTCLQSASTAGSSSSPTTTPPTTTPPTTTPTTAPPAVIPTTTAPAPTSTTTAPAATTPLLKTNQANPAPTTTGLVAQAQTVTPLSGSLVAGQKCVENLFAGLGVTQAKCFSANGFTEAAVEDAVAKLLSGSSPDAGTFSKNLQGLLTCLTGSPTSSAPAQTGGGGATAAAAPASTSGEAPPATPVVGTPNFTG